MDYSKYFDLLKKNDQFHILAFWEEYSQSQKEEFINQVKSIDFELLHSLTEKALFPEKTHKTFDLKPAKIISLKERLESDEAMIKMGGELLRAGKVGAFLVAGGQGSRLGFEGPKGMYKITPVKKKSLFQLHAEKILAVSKKYKTTIPWYIMTSITNHRDTVNFFEENKFFGFNPADVMFFRQEMFPAIDKKGKLLLSEKDEIFMSPNGHGGSIKALWDSGAHADMKKRGIDYLFYFQVDNVLTKICDPAFIGYHYTHKSDMSSKVLRKSFPEEKIGIICEINGTTGVVEYSDLSEEDTYAKDENGDLKYWAGSIAIHVINADFIEKENKKGFRLPYHIAEKNMPFIDEKGNRVQPPDKNGFKFETFVFDALEDCEKTVTLEVVREEEFSALKNKTGVDSEETSIRDMNKLYIDWLKKAGVTVPDFSGEKNIPDVEISPLFANSVEEVIEKKSMLPPFKPRLYLAVE